MEMDSLRLRVIFDDGGILRKSQKKDGLKRSWVMVKPQLDTISDVVSYLLHFFDLHHSCPHGIILSMDGFVLPPFESTAILKDKDIIRVKRKNTKLRDVKKAIEGAKTFIEDEVIEKQPLRSGVKLLANEEYNKETGGYESETDEDEDKPQENVLPLVHVLSRDVVSKKRKASSKIESSKTKRKRQVTPESVQKKHILRCERSSRKKRKHENKIEGDPISNSKVSVKGPKNVQPASESKKCSEANGNRERTTPVSRECDGAKRVTRSTRRKRLQRTWRKIYRAQEKMDKRESQLPVKDVNADSGSKKAACTNVIEHQQAVEESDAEGDLVPVVIRPGHIRFTSSGKVKDAPQNQETNGWDIPSTEKKDQESRSTKRNAWGVQKNKEQKETFKWNGITNKRKGQKWGTEKQPTSSWKESRDYNVSSSFPQQDYTSSHRGKLQGTFERNGTTNNWKGPKWGKDKQQTSSWKESREINAPSSDTRAARKQLPSDNAVDFEKLLPLTDLPKAGDVIAYRLLELSSLWCPELSSFRIGKITRFEPESNRIMVVPDPEYPLNLEKKTDDDDDDDDGQPPESSVYNEDGSLEIDFPSLVDVRIVKRGGPSQPECTGTVNPAANDSPASSGTSKRVDETQGRSKNVASDVSNGEVLQTPTPANGKRDVWEEISDALSAKKAQLMKDDTWNKKDDSAKRSWSHRSLRGSALGPTMAMLRAQNGI